uniref:Serine proteinase-like protein n=1 Tax=Sclerodermus guani TaxID=380176 RepID=A0A7D3QMH1_9HYME|nr:serine proteinase-like protein [Sclerodermus guani]
MIRLILKVSLLCVVLSSYSVSAKRARITDYPYVVSIRYDGAHICLGAIVSKNTVLSAASCVNLYVKAVDALSKLTIHLGIDDEAENGLSYTVTSTVSQSSYTDPEEEKKDNADTIIVLLSEREFKTGRYAAVTPFSQSTVEYVRDATFFAVDGQRKLNVLKGGILENSVCLKSVPTMKISKHQVCFIRPDDGEGCMSSSGSPVVHDGKLVAILPHGTSCTSVPVAAIHLAKFGSFIPYETS